jgi:hypothetical protein
VQRDEILGTSLNLHYAPMVDELFRKEVKCVAMSGVAPKEDASIPVLARRLEIFLDLLGTLCSSSNMYLMCNRFAGTLAFYVSAQYYGHCH